MHVSVAGTMLMFGEAVAAGLWCKALDCFATSC